MAFVPAVFMPIDAYTWGWHWPNMGADDEGGVVNIWGMPYITLQYTGTPTDVVTKEWPILDFLGTNEGGLNGEGATCWGVIATIYPPSPALMFDRKHDPLIRLDDRPRPKNVKPLMLPMADANRASLFLFCVRPWGPRYV